MWKPGKSSCWSRIGRGARVEIYRGLLALYDGFLCMFPAQHLLAGPGLLLAEQADRKDAEWGKMKANWNVLACLFVSPPLTNDHR